MDTNLAQKAISAAVCGNWKEALKLNKKILQLEPKDTDALNRIARAYAELGNIKEARKVSQDTLKIDPYNSIAKKCVEKWKKLRKSDARLSIGATGDCFIEEPGKTKIVPLLNTGSDGVIAKLDSGDEVNLNPHGHRIAVSTKDGGYIGRLPDDISSKIKQLVKLGKVYQTLIKSIEGKAVKVFIKEIASSEKASDIPSFTSERIEYIAFTSPELVHKKNSPTGEPEDLTEEL